MLTIGEFDLDHCGKQEVIGSKSECDCCVHSEHVRVNLDVRVVCNCGIQSLEASAIIELHLHGKRREWVQLQDERVWESQYTSEINDVGAKIQTIAAYG